jgi:hypothetical protein
MKPLVFHRHSIQHLIKSCGKPHNNTWTMPSKKEEDIMKRAFLSLTAALGVLALFAAAAQASPGEYYERGRGYYGSGYYGGGGGYYGASKFYGTVEAMPPAGVAGIWRISGRDVVVNQNTFIKQEYGPIGVGAYVEVKGGGNPLMAYELEVKRGGMPVNPVGPPPPSMGGMNPSGSVGTPPPPAMAGINFTGPVESLPPTGFFGTWRIGGRDVIVNNGTRIKQENGPISTGSNVDVKGGGNPFVAYEIESKP